MKRAPYTIHELKVILEQNQYIALRDSENGLTYVNCKAALINLFKYQEILTIILNYVSYFPVSFDSYISNKEPTWLSQND